VNERETVEQPAEHIFDGPGRRGDKAPLREKSRTLIGDGQLFDVRENSKTFALQNLAIGVTQKRRIYRAAQDSWAITDWAPNALN
jgi:hypothetical protein